MATSPQFIPLKKSQECLAVHSWRESPPPSVEYQADEPVKKRRRSRSKSQTRDDNFEDFIVHCTIPGYTKSMENSIRECSKTLALVDVGPLRCVPLKKIDDSKSEDNIQPPTDSGHLICLKYAEQPDAESGIKEILKRWPDASVYVTSRKRSSLNACLVLKGLPFTTKCEKLSEELQLLSHKPSYVRLLRGERGVFKCVVFVKYRSRAVAEQCKLELERVVVGTRPLKVEFKKKHKEGEQISLFAALEQHVKDLRSSREHEGFFYSRGALSKEEVKYLRHLCGLYELTLESSADQITVKRRFTDRPSPTLKPHLTTPPWVPATPGSLHPMDFRGIRHWKEMRQTTNTLGIVRPLGPSDGIVPFAAGRGRPFLSDKR